MSTEYTLEIPIVPVPKGRPRVSGQGKFVRMYTPPKTAKFEKEIEDWARASGITPLEGPLEAGVLVGIPITKSWTKKKKAQALNQEIYPTNQRAGDLDNFVKAVWDALNGVAYEDDGQIVSMLPTMKYYSEKPHIIVTIKKLKHDLFS